MKLGRLAVPERDRARLVEEEDVDVAGRLDRAPRHREDVVLLLVLLALLYLNLLLTS
jgi:hypothetical protein